MACPHHVRHLLSNHVLFTISVSCEHLSLGLTGLALQIFRSFRMVRFSHAERGRCVGSPIGKVRSALSLSENVYALKDVNLNCHRSGKLNYLYTIYNANEKNTSALVIPTGINALTHSLSKYLLNPACKTRQPSL